MPWFTRTPTSLPVTARSVFIPAGEALERAEQRHDDATGHQNAHDRQERPSDDWAATGLLLLARLQLDQMREILQKALAISSEDDAALVSELRAQVESAGLPPDDDGAFELDCVEEALTLRQALRHADLSVSHGFAPDGSIALTIGPSIPRLGALGLCGSSDDELNDEPDVIFDRAAACTEAAALLVSHLLGRPRQH